MWLLPSLCRPEKLNNFLKSAIQTNTTTPGLILIDENDWGRNELTYKGLAVPDGWEFKITKAITMGDKIREAWGSVAGNWAGVLNDDHFCVTDGWDRLLLKKLDGKNFVHANDRWMAPMKATTATVWSKPLLDCLDWPIYPPHLQHLFIDDVWEQLGRATGCWRPVMGVIVEHHHVLAGKAKDDETHQKVYAQKAWELDHGIFQNIMKHDFPKLVEKIRAFQDKLHGQRYVPLDKPKDFLPTGINMD